MHLTIHSFESSFSFFLSFKLEMQSERWFLKLHMFFNHQSRKTEVINYSYDKEWSLVYDQNSFIKPKAFLFLPLVHEKYTTEPNTL